MGFLDFGTDLNFTINGGGGFPIDSTEILDVTNQLVQSFDYVFTLSCAYFTCDYDMTTIKDQLMATNDT